MYYTWKNIKKLYKNTKSKISAPTWSDKLELFDRSHSLSGIQDDFVYIIKKHETVTDNPVLRTYVN